MRSGASAAEWREVPWNKARWLLRFPWDWPGVAWAVAVALVDFWEPGPPLPTPPMNDRTVDEESLAHFRSLLRGGPESAEAPPEAAGQARPAEATLFQSVSQYLRDLRGGPEPGEVPPQALDQARLDEANIGQYVVEAVAAVLRTNKEWADALGVNEERWFESQLDVSALLSRRAQEESALIQTEPSVQRREALRKAWKEAVRGYAEAARLNPSASLSLTVADMYALDLGQHQEAAANYGDTLRQALAYANDLGDEAYPYPWWALVLKIASVLLQRGGLEIVDPELRQSEEIAESGWPGWQWDARIGLIVESPSFLTEAYPVVTTSSDVDGTIWLAGAATIYEAFLNGWLSQNSRGGWSTLTSLLELPDTDVLTALCGLRLCYVKGATNPLSQSLFDHSEGDDTGSAVPELGETPAILWMDVDSKEIKVNGIVLDVGAEERDLLCFLYKNRGRLCTRLEVSEWVAQQAEDRSKSLQRKPLQRKSPQPSSSANPLTGWALDKVVSNLRKALRGAFPQAEKMLKTNRGYGFTLLPEPDINPLS